MLNVSLIQHNKGNELKFYQQILKIEKRTNLQDNYKL